MGAPAALSEDLVSTSTAATAHLYAAFPDTPEAWCGMRARAPPTEISLDRLVPGVDSGAAMAPPVQASTGIEAPAFGLAPAHDIGVRQATHNGQHQLPVIEECSWSRYRPPRPTTPPPATAPPLHS